MKKTMKQKIRNIAGGTATGLAVLLSTGCPQVVRHKRSYALPKNANVSDVEISNRNWFSGRTEELCENDLQETPRTFEYGPIVVSGADIPLGFNAEIIPVLAGKDAPIRASYNWQKIEPNTWKANITVYDVPDEQMNSPWVSGSTWTLGTQVYDARIGPSDGLYSVAGSRPF